ncbi:MAG TPA: HAD family phosphatase [Anaerolineaceae bacterium]|nr:HAD family phosphatase [Anaerolineaceae bacterium]
MPDPLSFKAVLWDLDGVIVDSFDGHFRAWSRLFAELGEPFTLDDFRRTFGMNNRNIFKTLLARELPEEEFWRLSQRKEAYFREDIRGNARLLPGVADWLERFDRLGLKQAIASSAPQENIDAHLDELGIRAWFAAVASGEKLRGKPDPAVFLLAAKLLGVEPSECLVIEDAVPGVAAAKSAGMRCLAVLTTNPPEKLAQADMIVKDLAQFTGEMPGKLM